MSSETTILLQCSTSYYHVRNKKKTFEYLLKNCIKTNNINYYYQPKVTNR